MDVAAHCVSQALAKVFARVLLGRVCAVRLRPTLAALKQLSAVLSLVPTPPLLGLVAAPAGGVGSREYPAEMLLHTLRPLVASEHFKLRASALLFIYNHLDKFGEPTRLEALRWLHDAHFANLALHWSRVVRSVFLHIVVIKVLGRPPAVCDLSARAARRGRTSSEGAERAPRGRSGSHDAGRPRSREALPSKSASSSGLGEMREMRELEYLALRGAYEESLELLQRLAGPAPDAEALARLADGNSAPTRRCYAKFARRELEALRGKWEEVHELAAEAGSGAAGEAAAPKALVLSMNVISDDQAAEEAGSGDEW